MPYACDTILAGKLRVVRLLGEGGLGEVYEVEHQLTRHRRALKVLKPQWRHDTELVERFLREASAAGHIGNPHIVETFDAGTLDDGSPYLLMEMLEGQSLDVVLRWHGRLDPGVAVQLLLQVCDAVGAAHRAGIIHRDLKPENLFLLRKDGHSFVKVLDFGISKFDTGLTGRPKVTNTHTSLGTPLYMSPEQMRASRDVDERADVYALGVILYEAIAGTPPFVADSFAELAAMALRGEARPLHEVMSETPPALSRVVARAMAPDRTQRYPSARAFADALEPFALPGVTSLTELPERVRLAPRPEVERQPTVSPYGPTARPDEDTVSAVAAPSAPTEEATPVVRLGGSTTVVPSRWLRLGAVVAALGVVGGVVAVSMRDTRPADEPSPAASRAALVPLTIDAGALSAEARREEPATKTEPVVAEPPAVTTDAGEVVPTRIEPVVTRPKAAGRDPVRGVLRVTCDDDPCAVHLPGGKGTIDTPVPGVPVAGGSLWVTNAAGNSTGTFQLRFTRPGEVVTLHASPKNQRIEVVSSK